MKNVKNRTLRNRSFKTMAVKILDSSINNPKSMPTKNKL